MDPQSNLKKLFMKIKKNVVDVDIRNTN